MTLSQQSHFVLSDCDQLARLIRKLQKPQTSPNWENEKRLLVRQIKLTKQSLSLFEKTLEEAPKSA